MKITMIRGKLGSNDGVTTKFYEEGETYEVSDALGHCFLEEQVAEEISAETAIPKTLIEGNVYKIDGEYFVAGLPEGATELGLLPLDQVTDEERAELVAEGKLTKKQAKAIAEGIKNKALGGAPQNKAQ